MPIETMWGDSTQSILIEKFRDDWSWHQVTVECSDVIHPRLAPVAHPVVLIQDMVGSHWVPTVHLLKEVETMLQTPYPDNIVMLIVVSGDVAVDTLLISAYKRFGSENCSYQSCSSVNRALQIASDFLDGS